MEDMRLDYFFTPAGHCQPQNIWWPKVPFGCGICAVRDSLEEDGGDHSAGECPAF